MSGEKEFSLEVVAPVFPVTDIKRSTTYFTEKLQFTVGFEWADSADEPLSYAILQQDNTELHLTLAKAPNSVVAYFFVNNVQRYYQEVKAKGADITHELGDQPWEMREFEVSDPDGNRIIFGEHLSRIKET
jgi:catechol 2,3-dioxygenase-like lactoylglutathione lyase family enzyme